MAKPPACPPERAGPDKERRLCDLMGAERFQASHSHPKTGVSSGGLQPFPLTALNSQAPPCSQRGLEMQARSCPHPTPASSFLVNFRIKSKLCSGLPRFDMTEAFFAHPARPAPLSHRAFQLWLALCFLSMSRAPLQLRNVSSF